MNKVIIAIITVFALATLVYAGTLVRGKVADVDGSSVVFDFPKHDITVDDKVKTVYGGVGTVTAVEGNKVTVEFPDEFSKQIGELRKKLQTHARIHVENGGKDGKFTVQLSGC